ncbi:MAG: hypothetical protein P8164_16105 [Gammaproteobacteria bacterium]
MNMHISAFPTRRAPSRFCFHAAFGLALTIILLSMSGCATTRTTPLPVTVSEVRQMVRAGVSTDEIIAKMRASRTVYRLNAAQLAHLKKEGVPDRIINYMQRTYLRAVRRHQAAADWRYWSLGPDGYWYGGGPYGWPDDWVADDVFDGGFPDDSGIEQEGMEQQGDNGREGGADDRGTDR